MFFAIIIVLLILVVVYLVQPGQFKRDHFTLERTVPVRSQIDGLSYRVHTAHGGSEKAANILAEINRRAIELMRFLRKKYLRSEMGLAYPGRAKATRRLLKRWNPDNLAENSPQDPEGDTSYTIDKGAIVAICLRASRDRHGFHDINTIMFVSLHEMTHIAIEILEHPPAFWEAFKFILQEATQAGLIRSRPYKQVPLTYWCIRVDYNPLYDPGLPTLS